MKISLSAIAVYSFGIALLAADGLVLFGIIYRIATDPGNHISLDTRWLYVLYAPPLLFGLMLLLWKRKFVTLTILLLVVGFVGLASVFAIDHFNILIGYDEWIQRGMPGRPF